MKQEIKARPMTASTFGEVGLEQFNIQDQKCALGVILNKSITTSGWNQKDFIVLSGKFTQRPRLTEMSCHSQYISSKIAPLVAIFSNQKVTEHKVVGYPMFYWMWKWHTSIPFIWNHHQNLITCSYLGPRETTNFNCCQTSIYPDTIREEGEDGFQWKISSFCLSKDLDLILRAVQYCRILSTKQV